MRATSKMFLIAFMLLLLFPTVDWLWNIDPFSRNQENRKLAECPALPHTLGELMKFRREFPAYFNDNVGFRNALIRGNFLLKYRLLGVSPSSLVLIGKEGWLFYAGDREADDCRGISHFTTAQLRREAFNYELKKRWLEQQGIHYLLVLAPNKSTVYPEYLPEALTRVRDVSVVGQFVQYMKQSSLLDVIDLRAAVTIAKAQTPVYLKTDTHWNSYGAFAAYTAIMKPLGAWFPQVKPLRLDDYVIVQQPCAPGDLAGMIGGREFLREDYHYQFTPRLPRPVAAAEEHKAPGANPELANHNGRLPRAVVFRDSFFGALLPFIEGHLGGVAYYSSRWNTEIGIEEIIRRHQPDIVIEEIVERQFKVDQCDFRMHAPPCMRSLISPEGKTDHVEPRRESP